MGAGLATYWLAAAVAVVARQVAARYPAIGAGLADFAPAAVLARNCDALARIERIDRAVLRART